MAAPPRGGDGDGTAAPAEADGTAAPRIVQQQEQQQEGQAAAVEKTTSTTTQRESTTAAPPHEVREGGGPTGNERHGWAVPWGWWVVRVELNVSAGSYGKGISTAAAPHFYAPHPHPPASPQTTAKAAVTAPVLLEVAFSRFQPRGGGDASDAPPLALRSNALKDRLTRDLLGTYEQCNPKHRFKFKVPRRILTQPKEPAQKDGFDNVEANLICSVGDTLTNAARGASFTILDLLGQGTFGQVFKCQQQVPQGGERKPTVAIKVVKNKPAYLRQAQSEVGVLRLLNEKHDPGDEKHIVRLLDSFSDKSHLCLVFELLDLNLYELLKQNQFRGLPLSLIRHFVRQILQAMGVMEEAGIIHCDLKPENILLSSATLQRPPKVVVKGGGNGATAKAASSSKMNQNSVKVIDFGSACFEGRTMYTYIQSRFYRSPEVLLGLPYDAGIDMWSLGCICAEMFLGLPIFPGVSEHNQLTRIVEMLGAPPEFMLEHGGNTGKYFRRRKKTTGGGETMDPYRSSTHSAVRAGRTTLTKVGEEEADAMDAPLLENQQVVGARSMAAGAAAGGKRGLLLKSHTLSSALPAVRGQQMPPPSSSSSSSSSQFALKTAEEYASDTRTPVVNSKKYFKHKRLPDIVRSYPYGRKLRAEDMVKEDEERRLFLNLVLGLLDLNPWKRWTARQAAEHPFVQVEPASAERVVAYEPPDTHHVRDRRLHAMLVAHQQRNSNTSSNSAEPQHTNNKPSSSSSQDGNARGAPVAYLAAAAGSVARPPPSIHPRSSEPIDMPPPLSPIPPAVLAARSAGAGAGGGGAGAGGVYLEDNGGVSIFRHSSSSSSSGGVDEGMVHSAPAFHRLRIMNRRASVGMPPSTPQTAPGGMAMSMGAGGGMMGSMDNSLGGSLSVSGAQRWGGRALPMSGGGGMAGGNAGSVGGGGSGFLAKGAESYTYDSAERLGATDFGYALQRPQMMMQFSPQQQSAMHMHANVYGTSMSGSGSYVLRSPMPPGGGAPGSYGGVPPLYLPEELDLPPPPLHHPQHPGQYAHAATLSPSLGQQGIEGEFAEWDPFFAEPLEDEQEGGGGGGRSRAGSYGGNSPRMLPNGQPQHGHHGHGHGPPSPHYHPHHPPPYSARSNMMTSPLHNTPPKQRGNAFAWLRGGGPPRHHRGGGGSGGGQGGGGGGEGAETMRGARTPPRPAVGAARPLTARVRTRGSTRTAAGVEGAARAPRRGTTPLRFGARAASMPLTNSSSSNSNNRLNNNNRPSSNGAAVGVAAGRAWRRAAAGWCDAARARSTPRRGWQPKCMV